VQDRRAAVARRSERVQLEPHLKAATTLGGDVDYDSLKTGLGRLRNEVIDARYQISYRGLTYMTNDRVLVDLLYTGWFKVETPDGPQWRRRLEPHRIVLAREDSKYRIVSGM